MDGCEIEQTIESIQVAVDLTRGYTCIREWND